MIEQLFPCLLIEFWLQFFLDFSPQPDGQLVSGLRLDRLEEFRLDLLADLRVNLLPYPLYRDVPCVHLRFPLRLLNLLLGLMLQLHGLALKAAEQLSLLLIRIVQLLLRCRQLLEKVFPALYRMHDFLFNPHFELFLLERELLSQLVDLLLQLLDQMQVVLGCGRFQEVD